RPPPRRGRPRARRQRARARRRRGAAQGLRRGRPDRLARGVLPPRHRLAHPGQAVVVGAGVCPAPAGRSPAPPNRRWHMESVLYSAAQGVARVTLNRPQVLNAIDDSLIAGMEAALDRIVADRSVRVVVLGGAGAGFQAGGDIKMFTSLTALDPE